MPDISANLALPYLAASQAQKHVTHNEALQILDAVVQLAVADRDRTDPPAAPGAGARHIVAPDAVGAWSGQGGRVALWADNAWVFIDPQTGWRAWVAAENIDVVWHDGLWQASADLNNLAGVGINTTADGTNRLSVSAPATLLNHEGAGHQLKINKAAAGDTASLLFQTGFAGRAEMGLAGNDAWAIKVSDGGTNWVEALSLDPATGLAGGAAVQAAPLDDGAGRLLAVGAGGLLSSSGTAAPNDDADACVLTGLGYRFSTGGANTPVNNPYGGSLIVSTGAGGEVHQIFVDRSGAGMWLRGYAAGSGGWSNWIPIVPERGSNANGSYTRFADGTLICNVPNIDFGSILYAGSGTLASPYRTGVKTITWPVSFSDSPAASISLSTSIGTPLDARGLVVAPFTEPKPSNWDALRAMRYGNSNYNSTVTASIMAIGRWY